MSDIPFFRTQMGQRFCEATMPTLVRELAKLNSNLERLLVVLERNPEPKATTSETPR